MGRPKKVENKEKTIKLEDVVLDNALKSIEKEYGKGMIMNIGETFKVDIDVIPTGSISLDQALGVGGVPRGRVVELFGNESAGKTTLALTIAREAQKLNLKVAYIDAEHALDLGYSKKIGANVEQPFMYISQPDYGEQSLDIAQTFIETGKFGLIIIDSVAALTPKAEMEGSMSDQQMGLQARLLSKCCRKLVGMVEKTNTCLIFINQIREIIGTFGYGEKTTTPGGRALKFYSSVRIDLRRIKTLTHAEKPIGTVVRATIKKNKVAPPFLTAEFRIYFDEGISEIGEIIDFAIKYKIITKAGVWFSYKKENIAQGMMKLRLLLKENKELYEEIKNLTMEKINLNVEDNIGDEEEGVK